MRRMLYNNKEAVKNKRRGLKCASKELKVDTEFTLQIGN